MASTYVNNLRLEEIGTGEQSGTWGDTTNTNLEIIGQAVAWGTRAIANASTDNITIADGALDADRCLGLKLTGGGQACAVTLLPLTSSKTWFIHNTTNSTLTFRAGSDTTSEQVAILAGETKVIATDGLGADSIVYDLLTAVNLAGVTKVDDLIVGDDLVVVDDASVGGILGVTGVLTTTAATVFNGGFASNADSTMGTNKKLIFRDSAIHISSTADGDMSIAADDEIDITSTLIDINGNVDISGTIAAADALTMATNKKIIFRDSAIHISSTADGDMSIAADDEIDITSTLIDVNGNLDVSGTALVTDVLTTTAAAVFNGGFAANSPSTISTANNSAQLTLISTDADANVGPNLTLFRNSANPDDNDAIGRINFQAQNDRSGGSTLNYAFIESFILDASDGAESAELTFKVATAGTSANRLKFNATETVFNDGSLDLNFRVESNNHDNIFFIDGEFDGVGIGNSTIIDWSTNYPGLQMVMDTTKIAFDSSASGSAAGAITGIPLFQMTPAAGSVFNIDRGGVIDFRVASGANNHMLFVDASADVVSIGSSTIESRVGQQLALTSSGGTDRGGIAINAYGPASAAGPIFDFNVSRATSPGSHTVVANGDALGTIIFRGDDGDEFRDSSFIEGGVNGTPGNNDMPGLIKFGTQQAGGAMAEKMRLTSTGSLLIGTDLGSEIDESGTRIVAGVAGYIQHARTSTSDALPNLDLARGNDGKSIRFLRNDGTNREVGDISMATNAISFNSTSDYRLKENVDYTWDATTRLKQLKPARFNFISTPDTTIDGFIAHETQAVVPQAVTGVKDATEVIGNITDNDGNIDRASVIEPETVGEGYTWTETGTRPVYQSMDASKLVPLLVKTILELEARITALEA